MKENLTPAQRLDFENWLSNPTTLFFLAWVRRQPAELVKGAVKLRRDPAQLTNLLDKLCEISLYERLEKAITNAEFLGKPNN